MGDKLNDRLNRVERTQAELAEEVAEVRADIAATRTAIAMLHAVIEDHQVAAVRG